ncbi:hypothetical protein PILCRDRAFT_822767 [Piloderma croceum F 1598]|uniref:Uncharacterized protein n=1 Tax=Piloderma croceum (strain F 1598) TaxID=765440 RepID=A0A0C3FK22_PILCF|nr:hypothetical protein PILCRDRAFT_822767 [Piloderma croceum F 1598]
MAESYHLMKTSACDHTPEHSVSTCLCANRRTGQTNTFTSSNISYPLIVYSSNSMLTKNG